MAVQADFDAATQKLTDLTAATVAAATNLQAATAQLIGLNIPVPNNPAPLLAAVDAQVQATAVLTQAVTDNQTAVANEAAKINPPQTNTSTGNAP